MSSLMEQKLKAEAQAHETRKPTGDGKPFTGNGHDTEIDAATIALQYVGTQGSNGSWNCRCPAHDDENPSFGIIDNPKGPQASMSGRPRAQRYS
jgi:hypothetical protein